MNVRSLSEFHSYIEIVLDARVFSQIDLNFVVLKLSSLAVSIKSLSPLGGRSLASLKSAKYSLFPSI